MTTPIEMQRRANLAERIRRVGKGHRLPIELYRRAEDTEPAVVGKVQAIETGGVRVAGSLVPWSGLARVEPARDARAGLTTVPLKFDGQVIGTADVRVDTDEKGQVRITVEHTDLAPEHRHLRDVLEPDLAHFSIAAKPRPTDQGES